MTRVLALDLGTSSARARLYDERGRHVEGVEAQERYSATRGHSGRLGEFDADELVEVVRSAVDEALREAGPVDAVAASSFWHSLVALDGRGRPLTNVSTWRDTRATADAVRLADRLDAADVHAGTGCPLHASFWPARLARLRREEPDLFRAAARFVSFPDYVLRRLAGAERTSVSTASATGLWRVGGGWDEELLAELELEPERLPEVSDEAAGDEVPWFPAWGDGACANVGAGCVTRERAALTIGTSAAYRVVFEAGEPTPRPGLFLFRVDAHRVVEGGSLSDGGNLWDWLKRTLAEIDAEGLADEPADGHGLTFLTLLGGERSPGWDGHVRGAVTGLSFHTGPRELVHAALEGVGVRIAEVADLLPEVTEVVGTGAALLANRDLAQVVADVLGRPLRLGVEEASARGAAVLALERLGVTAEEAPLGDEVRPRDDRTRIYSTARRRQQALYDAIARDRRFAAIDRLRRGGPMPEPILIVGGGLASARIVEKYCEAGGDGDIVLVSADTAPPYHRPPLSKRFLRGESQAEDAYVRPEEFYAEHDVELRLETRVERIDVAGKAVELSGGERIAWDRLVLATGAVPRAPGIPGEDLDGVTTFRWIDDAKGLRAAAEDGARAVVAGSGFIGMEISASLRTVGRDVALVYRDALYGQFGVEELSRALDELYREKGVELLRGEEIAEVVGNGRVQGARLSSGRELEAELAVFGFGVDPAVQLAEDAGLEVEDGIVVNERFETSAPGVYSVGDVAAYWDPLFERRRRIEHWSNASYQGQQLGQLLAGEDAPYDTLSTFFTEVFGITIKVFGDGVKPDEVVTEDGFSLEQGLAWYVRGGRVEGALLIGQSEEREAELKELLAQRPERAAVM